MDTVVQERFGMEAGVYRIHCLFVLVLINRWYVRNLGICISYVIPCLSSEWTNIHDYIKYIWLSVPI